MVIRFCNQTGLSSIQTGYFQGRRITSHMKQIISNQTSFRFNLDSFQVKLGTFQANGEHFLKKKVKTETLYESEIKNEIK